MDFIISILLTMISYMAYPFIKFKLVKKNVNYTKEQIRKTCIINSVVVAIIFLIISSLLIEDYMPNFIPAVFWGCINLAVFRGEKKSVKEPMPKSSKVLVGTAIFFLAGFALLTLVAILITMFNN